MKFLSFLVLYTLPFIIISTSVYSSLSKKKPIFSAVILSPTVEIIDTEITEKDLGNKIIHFPECEVDITSIAWRDILTLGFRFKTLSLEQFAILQELFIATNTTNNEFNLPYSYMVKVMFHPQGTEKTDIEIILRDNIRLIFHVPLQERFHEAFCEIMNKKIRFMKKGIAGDIRDMIKWLIELKGFEVVLEIKASTSQDNPDIMTLRKLDKLVADYQGIISSSKAAIKEIETSVKSYQSDVKEMFEPMDKVVDKIEQTSRRKKKIEAKLAEIENLNKEEQMNRLRQMMKQEKEEMLKTIESKKSSLTEHLANRLILAIKKKNYVKLHKINTMFPEKDNKDKVITNTTK